MKYKTVRIHKIQYRFKSTAHGYYTLVNISTLTINLNPAINRYKEIYPHKHNPSDFIYIKYTFLLETHADKNQKDAQQTSCAAHNMHRPYRYDCIYIMIM